MLETRKTFRLLAIEHFIHYFWHQYISLQNLGQRIYHKSAGCEFLVAASV